MRNQSNLKRRYDLDWLRIVGVSTVLFFHCFRIFGKKDFFINNGDTSIIIHYIPTFFKIWMMPLLFVVSGAAMYYSLRLRGPKKFIKNRFY